MIIGVTGGIGCGKSTVLNILKEDYKATIIKADDVACEVMVNDEECISKLKKEFSDNVYLENGTLNKEFISNIIFRNREKHDLLDSIVHPIVKKYIKDKMKLSRARITVIEAALLIESGYTDMCDEVWYVYCEHKERVNRIIKERNLSVERINEIMNNQLNEDQFKRYCDKLINNSFDIEFTKKEIQRVLIWG